MSRQTRTFLAICMVVSLLLIPALSTAAADINGTGPFDVKFAGVITAAPAAAGEPWQIAGQTVKTDANTKILLAEDRPAAAGMWADVMANKQTDGSLLALKLAVMPAEMRLTGPLQAMAEGDLGTWTVAGVDFTVNADTKISDRGEPLMVDGWVEVRAVEDAGALMAVSIKSAEEQEDVELYGAIQKFSDTEWTVSSVAFAVNGETRIMGKAQEGLLAKIALKLQEDGSRLARTIKVAWDDQGSARRPVQFTGKIEALPTSGLVGLWTVDGKQVDVAAQTKVMQRKALAEMGATVHVVGWTEGDVVKAIVVTVMAPPGDSKPFQLIGVIEGLPAEGLIGVWTVSGNQIQVTAATRIAGQQFAKVGASVTVVGTQKADGAKTATVVHAKKSR